ncbi:PREDICTED: uncharacterized protein LOC109189674 [Ipomoea nil]|uniref:uncharacterized protein LOC109189674 n=1 Tax=Ipomoea nil TaxID=35883 RepID=UPI00090102A1|nr:PREDICTED: uncharacterized protein LOC109189674 [Ipomoea nil]
MDYKTPFTALTPPVFKGENYQVWAARMEAHLKVNDLWDAVKEDYEVPPLTDNPRDEKLKGMQKLNLIREFEMQQMKESETIKEFDATISSMESSKDLSTITLAKLNSALQAQEQRRLMRSESSVEGALQAKLQINHGEKDKKKSSKKNPREAATSSKGEKKRDFPPCKHCGKKGHPPFKCWRRPDVKCGKCNKLGHHERICKSNLQQKDDVQIVSEEDEEQMFVASCFTSRSSSSSYCWLLGSGSTNHMTGDEELFRELDRSQVSNVRIGNGDCIPIKRNGLLS